MKVKRTIKNTVELDIIGATLLTTEEVEQLPKRLRRYDEWWWLRSPGTSTFASEAAVVKPDGSVCYYGICVDEFYTTVRPALILSNLESSGLEIRDTFEFGRKEFEIISEDKALCLSDIKECAFRKDYKANDANDYEKSDVKKFIDNWFETEKEE